MNACHGGNEVEVHGGFGAAGGTEALESKNKDQPRGPMPPRWLTVNGRRMMP